jgi:hypothetical protein
MPEVIADLETTVTSADGDEYYVQVAAEQIGSIWEAWLEFVPLDDSLDVLLTRTETTQPTRSDVVRWSTTLTPVFLEGAFARAVQASSGRRIIRDYPITTTDVLVPFDPFAVFRISELELRGRLRLLARSELLAMIEQHGLNPAEKSLARLTESQLVTFIVTAVEVQLGLHRHA